MPPVVALILCTSFVIYLLRLDYKQAPEASPALWIPTIWMLYAMSRTLGSWFHMGGTMEEGSFVDRVFLTTLLCLNVIVLVRRHFNLSAVFRSNPWLIVLLGYMTISLLWSSMPFISLKRWFRELVALTAAFQLLTEIHPRMALRILLRRVFYITIPFSLFLIKYNPSLGRKYNSWTGEPEWIGVADTKNHLAKLCVIAILFLALEIRQKWKARSKPIIKHQIYAELVLVSVSFWMLGGPGKSLTYSATSTIVLVLGMLVFIVLWWARKKGITIKFAMIGLTLGLVFAYGTTVPFIGGLSFLDVSSVLNRDATLTTRTTNIWSVLVPLAMDRPLVGHGVGGFWTTAMEERTTASAHNGYLDALLHYGFIGLSLIFFFVLSCVRVATMAINDDMDWGILFICLIFIVVVHNITESSIHSFSKGMTALMLLFLVTFSQYGSKEG